MLTTQAFERYICFELVGKSEKTKKNYLVALRSMVRCLGDIPIELLGTDQVKMWHHDMLQMGNTNTSIASNMSRLRSVLGYLRDQEMRVLEPGRVKRPALDTPPKVYCEPAEVQKMINATKGIREKALVACLFCTGARVSELLSLDREAIETAKTDDNGVKEVWIQGKGGKYRPLFFPSIALDYLRRYLHERDSKFAPAPDPFKPLFMSAANRRLGVSRVEQLVTDAAIIAGLKKHVTPHTLRHSFATDLLINEAPLDAVSKVMGHASATTTSKIYSHIDSSKKKLVLGRFQSQLS